ncbi:MAG: DUF1295 domain-containing protein [Chlamydiales bacterium]|nr:DUF1295 domain-containing protein [Chlamydiia bacterium]MCP5508713.1 DUF1295 domain-containing protein [Chlamydiales bacterium]
MSMIFSMLICTAIIVIIFFLLWVFAMLARKPELVDIAWTLAVVGYAWYYFVDFGETSLRSYFLIAMVSLWGLRLSSLLMGRLLMGQTDRRYRKLDRAFANSYKYSYLLFYGAQVVAAFLLSVPFALAFSATARVETTDFFALALCVIGFFGEFQADATMARFRAAPDNKGKVCKRGFWKYSRHPNLFFDWIQWIGFACFALASPLWWIAVPIPFLMLYMMLCVTGIPPTEEVLLESKGDVYREYQRSTSAFIPWFPRSDGRA